MGEEGRGPIFKKWDGEGMDGEGREGEEGGSAV